jgi:GNAT superfamily N-acetyltransferase
VPITIRSATAADVAVIAENNRRIAHETEGKDLDPPTITAGVAAAVADPARRGSYYLACDGDEVVGQMQVTFEWSDWRNGWYWWVQSVYVRADRRKQGVFGALYRHARAAALAASDVIGIRLYVEHDNHVAQATYDKLGMTLTSYRIMEECPLLGDASEVRR